MKHHTFKDYIQAIRPWSFPASSMTAVVTVSLIYFLSKTPRYADAFNNIHWWFGLLAILVAIIFQTIGNLISDYYDYKKGVDHEETHGTTRSLVEGVFKPKSFLRAGYILTALMIILGIYIASIVGYELLFIGLAGIIAVIFYFWFKYHALGDTLIFIIFGPLIALGTAFCMTEQIIWEAVYLSIPIGLLVVNILHANNTNDIKNDKAANISTVAMKLGFNKSKKLYIINIVLANLIVLILAILRIIPYISFIFILAILVLANKNIKAFKNADLNSDEPLLGLDGASAKFVMLFGLLLTISLIIASFL